MADDAKAADKPLKKNWVKRTIAGVSLILYFMMAISSGLPIILLHGLAIQVRCFGEVITIAYNSKKLPDMPFFRTLNWYFVLVANYFFCGECFAQHVDILSKKYPVLAILSKYHRFICFCLYFAGFIWFLNLLRRKSFRKQFSVLAWTHFLLIIIVLQSYMLVLNIFEGLIWMVIPVSLVILNDIFAYVFGRMYGKTPLIELSPKKTLEGFIGGGISTFALGLFLATVLSRFQYFVCPTKFVFVGDEIKRSVECIPGDIFQPADYTFAGITFSMRPFSWHSLSLSFFASIIAPFGGFCASGFKRAFKIKDFGDAIPGHGGLMDRFDCQYLMATFVHVYISTFIRPHSVKKVFERILNLDEAGQLEFYFLLKDSLDARGVLTS